MLTSSLLALSYSKEHYAKDNTCMIFFSTKLHVAILVNTFKQLSSVL